MNSMQPPSTHIQRRCSRRYPFPIRKSKSTVIASSSVVICPARSKFLADVAFIPDARWHRISAARLNLLLRLRKGVNIMPPAISQIELLLSTKGWSQSIAIREANIQPPVLLCSTLNLLESYPKYIDTHPDQQYAIHNIQIFTMQKKLLMVSTRDIDEDNTAIES